MKEYKVIIWDFNGTLIDDIHATLASVNDMLTRRNQDIIDFSTYSKTVDTPIWKFYEAVFIKGSITPEEAVKEFNEGYDKHLRENPLMEGAKEMLSFYQSLHKHQLIVSASNINKVRKSLGALGISEYFTEVLAMSDYNAGDKTFLAREYLEKNSISPSDAVVIGDCVFDFRMAQEIGADAILNTRGHQARTELSETGAPIIDDLAELKDFIK